MLQWSLNVFYKGPILIFIYILMLLLQTLCFFPLYFLIGYFWYKHFWPFSIDALSVQVAELLLVYYSGQLILLSFPFKAL